MKIIFLYEQFSFVIKTNIFYFHFANETRSQNFKTIKVFFLFLNLKQMINESNEVHATNQLTVRREFVEQRRPRAQTTVTERKFTIKMCRQLKRSYHPCLSSLDFQPKFSNFHFKNETKLKLLQNSVFILFFKYQFFFIRNI